MTLVTPAEGTLTVTAESDPDLFHVARVRVYTLETLSLFTAM